MLVVETIAKVRRDQAGGPLTCRCWTCGYVVVLPFGFTLARAHFWLVPELAWR